jgi:hypothetical protein
VDPGGETSVVVRVKNIGDVVDEFDFTIVGDLAPFATITPAPLRLFPDGEGESTVIFKVPRTHDIQSGEVPFGVKVASKEFPDDSVVVEGTLQVAGFTDVFAELLPRTSRGKKRGKHEVAIDNRGNSRLTAEITAVDNEDLLTFTVKPEALTIEPGMASFAKLSLETRKRYWRGPPMTRMFEVVVAPEGQEPHSLNGSFLQESTLPSFLPRLLRWLLVGAVLLGALWFFLLKPTIETAAQERAVEAVAPVAESTEAAAAAEAAGAAQAAAAENAAEVEALKAALEELGADVTPPTFPTPTNFDVRLAVAAPPAGTRESIFVVPDDNILTITDVVFQNPNGHAGELQVRRGDQILLIEAMENFRDLDYHFITPLVFLAGQELILEITCDLPAEGETDCGAGAYFGGNLQPTAPVEPEPEETPTG